MKEQLVSVSTKGQLAIPKAVRDRLHLVEGTRVSIRLEGDELRIRKADNWLDLRGLLADSEVNATEALLEERHLDQAFEK